MTARNERRRFVRASKVAARTRTKGGRRTAREIREAVIRGYIADDVREQRRWASAADAAEKDGEE